MAVFDTDLSEERIRRAVEGGYWRNERIEDYLDRWATTRPAKTALVDGAGRYTWAELARTV